MMKLTLAICFAALAVAPYALAEGRTEKARKPVTCSAWTELAAKDGKRVLLCTSTSADADKPLKSPRILRAWTIVEQPAEKGADRVFWAIGW